MSKVAKATSISWPVALHQVQRDIRECHRHLSNPLHFEGHHVLCKITDMKRVLRHVTKIIGQNETAKQLVDVLQNSLLGLETRYNIASTLPKNLRPSHPNGQGILNIIKALNAGRYQDLCNLFDQGVITKENAQIRFYHTSHPLSKPRYSTSLNLKNVYPLTTLAHIILKNKHRYTTPQHANLLKKVKKLGVEVPYFLRVKVRRSARHQSPVRIAQIPGLSVLAGALNSREPAKAFEMFMKAINKENVNVRVSFDGQLYFYKSYSETDKTISLAAIVAQNPFGFNFPQIASLMLKIAENGADMKEAEQIMQTVVDKYQQAKQRLQKENDANTQQMLIHAAAESALSVSERAVFHFAVHAQLLFEKKA